VRRIVREHRRSNEADRVEFGYVRWPQSFGSGALPWEAAASLMPLMRLLDERRFPRPTMRRARWYWRIMLAVPGLPVGRAYQLAGVLSAIEVGGQDPLETWQAVESRLLSAGETAEAVGVPLAGLDLDGAASVLRELSPRMTHADARDVLEFVAGRSDAEEGSDHDQA